MVGGGYVEHFVEYVDGFILAGVTVDGYIRWQQRYYYAHFSSEQEARQKAFSDIKKYRKNMNK